MLKTCFIFLLSTALSGCSLSFPMASLSPDIDETGSISQKPALVLFHELNPEDWRRARSAIDLALDPQGNGTRVNWDNPATGLKGSFIAKGHVFVENGEVCRAFQAHLHDKTRSDVIKLGVACRASGEDWTIIKTSK